MDASSKKIVKDFLRAVNDNNIQAMESLLAEKHAFIDSNENEIAGRAKVIKMWKRHFENVDAYSVAVDKMFGKEGCVVFTGEVSGFIRDKNSAEKFWRLPLSWKVKIENGKITQWQVFEDAQAFWSLLNELEN
ncbi:MAG: nuclear transport factor 2 family protein [Chlorobi bacterium]|nr:nuclear transport factor 2 family protein [Chlorobiota bacterium]